MDKQYSHTQTEDKIYQKWEESGLFSPSFAKATEGRPAIADGSGEAAPTEDSDADPASTDDGSGEVTPFTIIMPPPNANDPLHVGHAMFLSLEDVMIRVARMQGKAALWLPGTDHAGIETQFVFEKKLAKKKQSRFNFDRETLYQMIWEYVQENSGVAVEQMKKIGSSADWSRFKFMLEPEIVEQVLETFGKMNDEGLVYRDSRLVNYCTKCGTAFSELEANHAEQNDPLYYMKYGPFTLATVRPETKFGDTAVAVNPSDERYKEYVGSEIEVEGLLGKFKIKVIADEYVDPEFGTGVVKITPAHDPNDFEVWQRHKDEIPGPKQVIGFDGKLNELTGKYAGLNVVMGRAAVVKDLKEKGLIEKIDEKYVHNVATCYRCNRVLEPLPMPQFYVKVKPLTEPVLEAMDKGELEVYGAGQDKILRHWLENLKDWNISRQIVWGIRMPVWYKIVEEDGSYSYENHMVVSFIDKNKKFHQGPLSQYLDPRSLSKKSDNHKLNIEKGIDYSNKYSLDEIVEGLQQIMVLDLNNKQVPFNVSPTSPGENYIQETDTFDTWFSSAQWPFTTLKSGSKSKIKNQKSKISDDFERFYPTDVMETGYDILPFWVMRMLMVGKFVTGKLPFKTVYLHGLVRDQKGQKMSKSKGNVINPLEVIEKYGADALRMALVIRTTPGQDKNVGEQDFRAMRNFTNKIWNASRFIIMNLEIKDQKSEIKNSDDEFYEKLDSVVTDVTKQLEDYRIGMAAETAYNEFWHWYCDEVIESNKKQETSDKALVDGLVTFLKLLHPFVPFVTEEVWGQIAEYRENPDELLMGSSWPEASYG